MNTNKNEPINYVPYERSQFDYSGLTKREYAAIQIMAGFGSDESLCTPCKNQEEADLSIESIAIAAVKWADALFNELDKTEG